MKYTFRTNASALLTLSLLIAVSFTGVAEATGSGSISPNKTVPTSVQPK